MTLRPLTCAVLASLALLTLSGAALDQAHGQELAEMTGCWVSEDLSPTSLLTDATDPKSARVVIEKMLLLFERIEGTEYLVLGRIYEREKQGTYVLGPTYQNGAFNPIAGFLTFGFPMGGLDHVTLSPRDRLLYVHAKSSTKSAMSVRRLSRLSCREATTLEADLLKQQQDLR
ncbi:MAG: hypothetical protein AAF637_12035 [Pseudomonadota bacterium]